VAWAGGRRILFVLHLVIAPGRSRELRLAVVASGAGFLADTALIAAGVFTPVHDLLPLPLSPPWLVFLWVNFATTINIALKRLSGHPVHSLEGGSTRNSSWDGANTATDPHGMCSPG